MDHKAFRYIGVAALVLAAAVIAYLLVGAIGAGRFVMLTDEQAKAVLASNDYKTEQQRIVAEAAVSLKGGVHYFWGGKSRAIGPDPRWGEPALVKSTGSKTTGEVRPFGLDCSGFVAWCFVQINDGRDLYDMTGEGTWNQWQKSTPIKWSEIEVGDLVFQNEYPGASYNHVGVCIGYFNGSPVFAHCSASEDNVVVTTAGTLFKYARRPAALMPEG